MTIEGGCYCGALRYRIEVDAIFRGQCHCRECQFFAGGGANLYMGFPAGSLIYVKGEPKKFERADLERPVTREFCAECGTQILSRAPGIPADIVKVGTLDDTARFEGPQFATYTVDKPDYHHVPEGCRAFERVPG